MVNRVHSGWGHAVALSFDQLVAWGILYYAYSVLLVPIARDVGVSREFVAGAFSGALLVAGLLARPVGRTLDHLGVRPVLLAGAGAGVAALVALLLSSGPFTLSVAFILAGVAQALALYESAFRAVVHWFPAARARSRALLLLTSVAGFASTVFLPLTAALVESRGWREAVAALALVLALVVVPVRLSLPRGLAPAHRREETPTASSPAAGARWLAAAFALHGFASTGVAVFLVWHLSERGWPMAAAAALAGLAGASQVPGRLLLAPLQTAVNSRFRIPLLFVVQAFALIGIAAQTGVLTTLAVVLFGAVNGMMTLERATVTVEWYGRDSFGARNGDIASVSLVARAAAPYAVAVLRSGTGGYSDAFAILAAVLVAGAWLMAAAERARQAGLSGATSA